MNAVFICNGFISYSRLWKYKCSNELKAKVTFNIANTENCCSLTKFELQWKKKRQRAVPIKTVKSTQYLNKFKLPSNKKNCKNTGSATLRASGVLNNLSVYISTLISMKKNISLVFLWTRTVRQNLETYPHNFHSP